MTIITEEMRKVCRQHSRQEHIKIAVLNNQNLVISEIQGKVAEGNISIDNSSDIRRSCSLKLKLDSELLPSQNSLIWANKKMKISVGIYDLLFDKIVWFPMGVFLYKSTQISYSATDKSLSLTLLDKMANFSGDLNGMLGNDVKIANMGASISQAIRSLVTQIGGENPNNVLIEDIVDDNGTLRTLPYTLNKQSGDKILDILKELVGLYKYQTCYYNTDGVFVAEKTKVLLSDLVAEDFRDIDFTITSQVVNDISYIKNYVKVIGISTQPMVSVEDIQGINNETPINNSTSLKIVFNKPLYNSSGNRIANEADVKSYFQYNGTASNFVSATYDANLWAITFNIQGENGKTIKPMPNTIFDSSEIAYVDGGYVFSSKDMKWSRILVGFVIADGINDQIQFKLNFNKPLYNSSGTTIATGTSLKSSFYYADGSGNSSNFIDAIYASDNRDYHITLSFTNAVPNATIQINKDGSMNTNSIYDSAGLIYRTENYIMDGNTWTLIQDDSSLINNYQISAELSNTDNTSPYSIDNLGERKILIVNNQNIYTLTQAKTEAEYQLQIHSNLNEQVTLTCLALYYLDVNMLIYLYNKDMGIDGKYRIDKINFDFKNGTMNLSCSKLYM